MEQLIEELKELVEKNRKIAEDNKFKFDNDMQFNYYRGKAKGIEAALILLSEQIKCK